MQVVILSIMFVLCCGKSERVAAQLEHLQILVDDNRALRSLAGKPPATETADPAYASPAPFSAASWREHWERAHVVQGTERRVLQSKGSALAMAIGEARHQGLSEESANEMAGLLSELRNFGEAWVLRVVCMCIGLFMSASLYVCLHVCN